MGRYEPPPSEPQQRSSTPIWKILLYFVGACVAFVVVAVGLLLVVCSQM